MVVKKQNDGKAKKKKCYVVFEQGMREPTKAKIKKTRTKRESDSRTGSLGRRHPSFLSTLWPPFSLSSKDM